MERTQGNRNQRSQDWNRQANTGTTLEGLLFCAVAVYMVAGSLLALSPAETGATVNPHPIVVASAR